MDAEKTGKLICQLRNDKNLTQKELAEKLNVTDKAVSKWERGDGCPDVEMLPRLAEVFGVSVETIMEGEVRKSGIVGKGVKVKILDWTRMDIASREQLLVLFRTGQKVAEKMSQRISALHKENCFCECTSVDQLTNEELLRSFPTPFFLYSLGYVEGGIAVEVDSALGKRFLRQDCGKHKDVSDFDLDLLEKHFITDITGDFYSILYEESNKSVSFEDFCNAISERGNNPRAINTHYGEMCVLISINCRIGDTSGMVNFLISCAGFYKLLETGVFGRRMNVQSLENIKAKNFVPNLAVELGRFKAENVSLEEGKILILSKKYVNWQDNDPVDVVVGGKIVHTGVVCFTSNDLYAVRIEEDLIESPVVYDEQDYLKFVLGTAYLPDEDLRKLQKDSVVELSQEVCSMVQIFRGDVHVASGEVCIADGKFAVRVADVKKF